MAELVEQGFVTKEARKRTQFYVSTGKTGTPDLSRYQRQEQVRRLGLDRMMAYAQGQTGCLMQTLRKSLGDADAAACGRCSGCLGTAEPLAESGSAAAWLKARPVPINGYLRILSPGRALFDSHRRSPEFRHFMGARTASPPLPESLVRMVQLARELGQFAAVVPLPSSTWAGKDLTAQALAEGLGIPVTAILRWKSHPEARQGTLLNNDQRRANVAGRMTAEQAPQGDLLLLDDYTGSGATMREAARALKAAGHNGNRVPITMARVRWRLGRAGIV
jgi:ATP-dependent DNA helicase RecQ